jgi:predicted acylesterase/phospholipase RssA
MAETDSQLIATVQPNCLCAAALDARLAFTARPDANGAFPPARGDYRLLFGNQDITDLIREWSVEQIRFTIPPGSHTGFVWLTRYANTFSGAISAVLANLCGIPVIGGRNLPPAPRAIITIVQAPVIESFRVNRQAVEDLVTEACRAIELDWSVRLADTAAGQPLPPGASIEVTITDGRGNRLHNSTDPQGSWLHNPLADTRYQLSAFSKAGGEQCRGTGPEVIQVHREHRLYVQIEDPSTPRIVAGRTGTLVIRMSCPAPDNGAQIRLFSSDAGTLQVPNRASVFPGEDSTLVQFSTSEAGRGEVTITARLANHRDGTLEIDVLPDLTAIVLSGGGAKGSFEVGALFYLRDIWNDIHPSIVCGTSVGAINALAVAERADGTGIDTLETIWLGLQVPSDMYIPSPEFQQVFLTLGISVPDLVLHGAALPFDSLTGLLGYLATLGVGSDTAGWVAAGWAVGGPVGGLIAGIVSIATSDADKINQAIKQAGNASYAFDLSPTQQLIEQSVDTNAVTESGMALRLAVVALEDGALYYVTETGHLLRDRATNAAFDEPVTNSQVLPPPLGPVIDPATLIWPGFVRDALVAGTMASAAFPGIFQIRPIFTPSSLQYYMDGGVRQVLPTGAAVELGAQLIFAVAASPLSAGTFTRNPVGYPATLLPIVQRAISLQGDELDRYIRAPREGFCDSVERVLIQPAFEVHDTIAIDPGLIRINMAYGYFRAFDADQLRRGNTNALQFLLWGAWTDDLIGTRLLCHELEAGSPITSPAAPDLKGSALNIQNPGTGGLFNHDTLQQLRNLKNHIAELIIERFETFGGPAFPQTLRNAVIGDQNAVDWAQTWERHPIPLRGFLDPLDLWAPQQIDYGQVSDDPSIPPIPGAREIDVVEPYPIPDNIINALRAR